jgi:hypothetical protein
METMTICLKINLSWHCDTEVLRGVIIYEGIGV